MSASDPGRTTFRSNYYPVTIGDEFDLDDELRFEIPKSSSARVVTWLDPERVREVYEHLGRVLGETKAEPEPEPVSSGPATIAIVRTFDGEEVRLDEPEGLRIVHAADRILVRSLGDGSPTLGSFRRDFVAAAMAVEEWHDEEDDGE